MPWLLPWHGRCKHLLPVKSYFETLLETWNVLIVYYSQVWHSHENRPFKNMIPCFPSIFLPQEGWIPNYPWCCFSARIQSNTAPGGHLLTSSWTPFSGAEKHCCCKAEPSLMALSSLIGNMGSWVDGGVLTNGTTSDMICYDIWHRIFELWYSIGPRIWYDLIWYDMIWCLDKVRSISIWHDIWCLKRVYGIWHLQLMGLK